MVTNSVDRQTGDQSESLVAEAIQMSAALGVFVDEILIGSMGYHESKAGTMQSSSYH